VTGCDGTCDGWNFCKFLISNICDGVTVQNPCDYEQARRAR
jgi:hypothetical protein